jgi:hypothetical protein
MDKESKQQLHQLTETVTALGATVTTLTESVASLTSSVADLKAEMREGFAKVDEQFAEFKQDISDMKQDVVGMKQDIVELKQHQAAMQEDITGMKQDIASMKQDIANLQDVTYNLSVNLEDVDRRMGIGFASTTEQISGLKREMMEIKRELFLERGIRETEVDGLGKVQDSREAQANQRIDMIEAFLGDDFRQFQKRAA